jgi:hypothetical protein
MVYIVRVVTFSRSLFVEIVTSYTDMRVCITKSSDLEALFSGSCSYIDMRMLLYYEILLKIPI